MNITYSEKLLHYLKKKGLCDLRVSLAETAVESGYAEVLVEAVNKRQIEDFHNEKYRYIHTLPGGEELGGNVYITSPELELDEDIHFELKHFLGIKHITVRGIHAFRFR